MLRFSIALVMLACSLNVSACELTHSKKKAEPAKNVTSPLSNPEQFNLILPDISVIGQHREHVVEQVNSSFSRIADVRNRSKPS